MRGLLCKDFCLLKEQKQLLILFAVWIFLSVSGASMFDSGVFLSGFLGFLGSVVAVGTLSYDEYDNGFAFLFTLPISRRVYIREKYVFTFGVSFAFWLVAMVLAFVKALLGSEALSEGEMLLSLMMLPYMWMLASLMLPIYVRFGADKARVAVILILLIVFAAVGGVMSMAAQAGIEWKLTQGMLPLPLPWLILALLALCVLLTALSYRLSVHFMKKKEF